MLQEAVAVPDGDGVPDAVAVKEGGAGVPVAVAEAVGGAMAARAKLENVAVTVVGHVCTSLGVMREECSKSQETGVRTHESRVTSECVKVMAKHDEAEVRNKNQVTTQRGKAEDHE